VNIQQTNGRSVTEVLPHPTMEETRRHLIALRERHGATSAIGCRCSNIVELIQMPELPQAQYDRQMADLQQLLAAE
jgi:hypothetical protein